MLENIETGKNKVKGVTSTRLIIAYFYNFVVEEPLPAETPQVTEESAASEPAAEAAATPAADSEPAADTPAEDAEATPASDQDAAESPAPVS